MTSRAYHARPQQTLINALSQHSPHAVSQSQQLLYQIFPQLYRGEYFHCASFFRSEPVVERYDPYAAFDLLDGRVYEITELHIEPLNSPEVHCRCCIDVVERHDGEYLPFEIWFYYSAFESGRVDDDISMLRFARHWIWDFLYTKRDPVPWSRYGHPYICECR